MGYKWKRARLSLKHKRNEELFKIKQQEVMELQKLEDSGYIDLYFGDESHFGLTPNVPYAWQTKQDPILLTAAKGKYLNVVGLMSRKGKLYHKVLQSTFNSEKLIDFMDGFAGQTIKKTIVVLDNAPVHKSKKFMAKVEEWKKEDLWIYFIPPYSPELNLIEILWRRIKYQWLDFDAYKNFQVLEEKLNLVLDNFGLKYDIKF